MFMSHVKVLLLLVAVLLGSTARSQQVVEGKDGQTLVAKISLREPTRVKVDGHRINDVFGDVRSPDANPNGRIIVTTDKSKGEVFVRLAPNHTLPVNLFVSTDQATYGLVLSPIDTPADTIIIRHRANTSAGGSSARAQATTTDASIGAPVALPKGTSHDRHIKSLLLAMASESESLQSGIEVREMGRELALWKEARFSHRRNFVSAGLVGEHYVLTNISVDTMTLAEPELFRENAHILAIAIERHQLSPGDATNVWIVRQRGGNE
jgi:conjugal transfer pilus assembly protein TraK